MDQGLDDQTAVSTANVCNWFLLESLAPKNMRLWNFVADVIPSEIATQPGHTCPRACRFRPNSLCEHLKSLLVAKKSHQRHFVMKQDDAGDAGLRSGLAQGMARLPYEPDGG